MQIIYYEVFTGVMPDGTEVMVQAFRQQGADRTHSAQIAFRRDTWSTWGVPIQLEHRSTTPTKGDNQ
jgi:hypothetical protein